VPLKAVEAAGADATRFIVPIERLLLDVPSVVLNERGARRASHGHELSPGDLASASAISAGGSAAPQWRLLDAAGMLVGIAESRPGGVLHPVIVLV
jgi:hypothetical protein